MRVTVLDDYQDVFRSAGAITRLREKAEVRIFTEKIADDEQLIQTLKGSQAVILIRERTKFPAALLQALPDLELISQTGNHAYHIDIEAATRAGIVIELAPGAGGAAEMTIGLMIAIMRRIPQSDHALRRGGWPAVLGHTLKGKTLGILGMGRIGTEVAAIAHAFGMKVIAWGPTLTPERAARSQATLMKLDEVLTSADVVSVHLALSAQSRNLLDESKLRLLKDTAYFVNTARGAIVDEAALIKILRERAIAGAALDVFAEEPLPSGHPFFALDNVVLTPHLGWPTDSGFRAYAENSVTNILDYMNGKLSRAINPEAQQYRGGRQG